MLSLSNDYYIKLGLCGFGEPLLNTKLVHTILNLLKNDNRIKIVIVTNGANLKKELLEKSIFKRIDVLIISVAGWNKESYERISGLNYEVISNNLNFAKKVFTSKMVLSCVLIPTITRHKGETQLFWQQKGLPFSFTDYHSRGGWLYHKKEYGREIQDCKIFNKIIFISSDGLVLSCCHDIQQENVIGNCRHESLKSIIQTKMCINKKCFRICKYCDDFINS
jgi:MoaA/NifB/PqqE/SkfB family radical SAM enzyme